ncbi:ADP-ribosylation factor-like protein 15 [Styela clava]
MSEWPAICCGVCRICCFTVYQKCCCIKEPPAIPVYDLLCLGITNAGKTTLLSVLTSENIDAIVPTVGFIIKDIRLPNAVLKVKELGGAVSIRQYWHRYFNDVQGVIFVVDGSCTQDELHETTDALYKAIQNPELSTKPWLILCNKQDLEGACTEERAVEEMNLTEMLKEKPNIIVKSCSKTNPDGLRSIIERFGNRLNEIHNPEMRETFDAV